MKYEALRFMMDTTLEYINSYKTDLLRNIEVLTNKKKEICNNFLVLWGVRDSGADIIILKDGKPTLPLEAYKDNEHWYLMKNIYRDERMPFEVDVLLTTIEIKDFLKSVKKTGATFEKVSNINGNSFVVHIPNGYPLRVYPMFRDKWRTEVLVNE